MFLADSICKHLQKLKTRVVKNHCSPEWNDELTLSIKDKTAPVKLVSRFPYSSELAASSDPVIYGMSRLG